jgi:N-methylhydantoinase B/oxoprolinase/acetone carboxylase alpha subunit
LATLKQRHSSVSELAENKGETSTLESLRESLKQAEAQARKDRERKEQERCRAAVEAKEEQEQEREQRKAAYQARIDEKNGTAADAARNLRQQLAAAQSALTAAHRNWSQQKPNW